MSKDYTQYLEERLERFKSAEKSEDKTSKKDMKSYYAGIVDGISMCSRMYNNHFRDQDEKMPGDWQTLADGYVRDGFRVKISYRTIPNSYGEYDVWVDGTKLDVVVISRARDGGSDRVSLSGNNEVFIPRTIGSTDRIPTYNGEKVL